VLSWLRLLLSLGENRLLSLHAPYCSALSWYPVQDRNTQGSQTVVDIMSKRQYGWDPWTKTPVRLAPAPLRWEHVRLWCWEVHEEGYWIAITFFFGSVLFASGAIGAQRQQV
jgi:hypothetical protein